MCVCVCVCVCIQQKKYLNKYVMLIKMTTYAYVIPAVTINSGCPNCNHNNVSESRHEISFKTTEFYRVPER
jgi:hypothetical protein